MKYNLKTLVALVVFALFLCSCSEGDAEPTTSPDDDTTQDGSDGGGESTEPDDETTDSLTTIAVNFSAEFSPMTSRVTTSNFESGEVIYVSAYNSNDSLVSSGVSYSYDGSLFESDTPIYYPDSNTAYSFYAIYPTASLSDMEVQFSVKSDQSSGSNYSLSDLIFGYSGATSSATPKLTFEHLLSKVVINITSTDVDLSGASISVTAIAGVLYDLEAMEYANASVAQSIKMCSNGTNSYKVIVPPQSISEGSTFATLTTALGDSYIIDSEDISHAELLPNSEYTLNFSIADNSITFENPTIDGWDEVDM